MKVKELIEQLQNFSEDAEVKTTSEFNGEPQDIEINVPDQEEGEYILIDAIDYEF